jgi:hypothetical protein
VIAERRKVSCPVIGFVCRAVYNNNNNNNNSCARCLILLLLLLLLLLLFRQVDQQDVPITGQPSKKDTKTKKNETKRSNQPTVLRINRTIPTHIKQLASYCRSLMRGLK